DRGGDDRRAVRGLVPVRRAAAPRGCGGPRADRGSHRGPGGVLRGDRRKSRDRPQPVRRFRPPSEVASRMRGAAERLRPARAVRPARVVIFGALLALLAAALAEGVRAGADASAAAPLAGPPLRDGRAPARPSAAPPPAHPESAPARAHTAGSPWRWEGVERIVAVGDIHGASAELLQLLRETGIVDERRSWAGGAAHL